MGHTGQIPDTHKTKKFNVRPGCSLLAESTQGKTKIKESHFKIRLSDRGCSSGC